MKRLVFLVEGDTEVAFVNRIIIPYLYQQGVKNEMHAQTILTNRKQHSKGGVINYQYLKNDINRILAQKNVIITTLIDFFKLPTNFPNYSNDSSHINKIEEGIHLDFDNNPNVIPYIQKHELEALMFTSIDGFEIVVDKEDELAKLSTIVNGFNNPEDINNSPETAPSKRMQNIFNYDKVADSESTI